MGQDPGKGGAVTEDQKTPEQLRREIARTRSELGETAAALGAKTDVKGRAKERVHEIKENVSAKAPSGAGEAATSASTTVKRNPVPSAAIAAVLAGFALGWLVASRRQ
jgi:Tfp pilus assembly protein FimV